MTEIPRVNFRREGDPPAPAAEEPKPEPAAEEPEEGAPAAEQEPVPFNEDPKVQEYIERQVSKRVEGIEKSLTEKFGGDITKIREEFGKKREQNAEASKIPPWFGGNQEQWDAYREWFDGQLRQAEERAVTGTITKAQELSSAEQKRVDEATDYFKAELAAITADKALNPTGKPIDPNKLLKIVMDNDLVDSKGRWNYRAGMRLMNSHPTASHAPGKDAQAKKELAAATVDRGGGAGAGGEAKSFKTPADFKRRRPW